MTPQALTSIAPLRDRIAEARRAGLEVGLVPTMGALHAGHVRLMEQARSECGCIVVSIFVNPSQFDRAGDLDRYPRTLQADLGVCADASVDVVFAPTAEEMYPTAAQCAVEVGRVADHLCGRHRPGHLRGVATVVLKLLQIVRPDRAYFGEKDAQQLAVIRHLVRDFNVPVRVEGVPTVRDIVRVPRARCCAQLAQRATVSGGARAGKVAAQRTLRGEATHLGGRARSRTRHSGRKSTISSGRPPATRVSGGRRSGAHSARHTHRRSGTRGGSSLGRLDEADRQPDVQSIRAAPGCDASWTLKVSTGL